MAPFYHFRMSVKSGHSAGFVNANRARVMEDRVATEADKLREILSDTMTEHFLKSGKKNKRVDNHVYEKLT